MPRLRKTTRKMVNVAACAVTNYSKLNKYIEVRNSLQRASFVKIRSINRQMAAGDMNVGSGPNQRAPCREVLLLRD